MRTLNVGLVGCGAVATGFHLPAVARNPRTQLTTCCDADRTRAEECAAQSGATLATTDVAQLLASPVDLVIVATPPQATPHVAAAALRAGKAVLCEKPIATNLADGEMLRKTVAATRGLLQVGFIFRHNTALKRVRAWFREGRIGLPAVIRLGAFDEVWMDDVPAHNERLMGFMKTGSPLTMMGAHMADLVTMLLPGRPVRAGGMCAQTRPGLPGPNHWIGLLGCDDGSLAKLEVGWLHPFPREEREKLHYPAAREDEWEFFGPRSVVRYNFQTGALRCAGEDGAIEEHHPPQELNFDGQLQALIDAVDGKAAPSPDVEDGYRSLEMTLILEQAVRKGVTMAIAP